VAGAGTWVLDLDGVVWLQGEPIAGSADAIGRLREAGIRPLFVTNNSSPTSEVLQGRLHRCGIEAPREDVISSADAAATMLPSGSSALVLADDGVKEALTARGVVLVDQAPANAVVVGWTREFDYDRVATAAATVRSGARLIGTNEDATFPTPNGLIPGAGALLAAVATASGAHPEVAGKPHQPIVDAIAQRASDVSMAVGDRPSTDGALARMLGSPFGLVLSGVTPADGDFGTPPPDVVAEDLGALVSQVLGR
jgi:4-nitrophenyl phosphatase